MTLAAFNAADQPVARELLDACLDIDTWVHEIDRHRPYANRGGLLARGIQASAHITWEQVATALARHPRIGEKASGPDASVSAAEQAGVDAAELDDFASGNADYEKHFGHIFLICAAGLSGAQMLASLRERMTNDIDTEHAVVISELRKIADLRLKKAVTE